MRKLLTTLYITNELAYLSLDGENIVCKIEEEQKFRMPFDNIESIVCFNYLGCSPALMGKCVSKLIPINFVSPQGRFLGKVCGETKGNVFLRISQIEKFKKDGMLLSQNTMASKFSNTMQVIKRTLHDNPELRSDPEMQSALNTLRDGIESIFKTDEIAEIVGIEGNCAKSYFSILNKMITNTSVPFDFSIRTKHPPLDPINAVLSFVYTIYTTEIAGALETVGLDSYIGFCHTLRSGRSSLACDIIEELRCIVDRFVITLLNLKIIGEKDFEKQISGAVWLTADGKRKVLTKWQEKKRTEILHPFLKQKIQLGLLPYVQSNLLAKYVRGDINEYPCFLMK